MKNHQKNTRSRVMGIALILLGILFLLNNLDFIPAQVSYYLFNWKGVMLSIGFTLIWYKSNNKLSGILLIVISLFFITSPILNQSFGIHIRLKDFFWPAILTFIGISLLQKNRYKQRKKSSDRSMDYIHDTNIMGGGEVRVHSKHFKGGDITAIFGGSNYNMGGSTLTEGTHTLTLFILFGGSTLVVPSDWNVHQETISLFGGVSDQRKPIKSDVKESSGQLIIKGLILFGGIELKNY